MIELSNIPLPLDTDISGMRVVRKAIDARKKSDVHFVVTVLEDAPDGMSDEAYVEQLRAEGKTAKVHVPFCDMRIPDAGAVLRNDDAQCSAGDRPVVVGFGPAGMFCALVLAKAGLRPIVLERGACMEERIAAVDTFDAGGPLNPHANIQFGEGGAGTFSDGKLNTGTKSRFNRQVLQWLVDAGAPEDILIDAKPHIGTDVLRDVVRRIRMQIEELGGEVRFRTQMTGLHVADDRLTGIDTTCGALTATRVVLACGHSARDTFAMLHELGVPMRRKPFSVGVRIEHAQDAIDAAQYGAYAGHPALPPADYKLVEHLANGRDVYTFCMCPGGQVVCAASEEGGVVTNGMSLHARNGRNANAALLVGISPQDLPGDDPLEGVRFQRSIEQAAYRAVLEAGGEPYQAPAQRVGDFLAGDAASAARAIPAFAAVQPTYARGTVPCDLRRVLPDIVCDSLAEAIPLMDRKLHGFADPDAVMTAPETRSSSPVQIIRDDTFQSAFEGLYPCGEGCGYAGGIMSAAVDGINVAACIVDEYGQQAAVQALRAGLPVVMPTDTVAGVGVSIRHASSPQVLYDLKRRPAAKPIPWLVGSVDALDRYGSDIPDYARNLVRDGWPGALTVIVRANDAVPPAFASATGTIALRMPDNEAVLSLIRELGCPLAVTSANISGEPPVADVHDVDPSIVDGVGAVLEPISSQAAKTASSGQPSRIVDCTGSEPRILR